MDHPTSYVDAPASDEQISPGMGVMFWGGGAIQQCFTNLGALCCLCLLSLVIYYLRVIKWLTVLDDFLGWDLEFH